MALFIISTNCDHAEKVYVDSLINTLPRDVTEILVDDRELHRSLSLIGMKHPTREDGQQVNVVKFFGDQAKFIVGNW